MKKFFLVLLTGLLMTLSACGMNIKEQTEQDVRIKSVFRDQAHG